MKTLGPVTVEINFDKQIMKKKKQNSTQKAVYGKETYKKTNSIDIRTTRSNSTTPVLIAYNLGLIVQASKEEIEVKYLQAKLQQLYIDARNAKVESHSLDRIVSYLIRMSSTPLTEVWSGWPTCGQNNFQTQTELYPDIRSLTVTLQDVRTALRKGILTL